MGGAFLQYCDSTFLSRNSKHKGKDFLKYQDLFDLELASHNVAYMRVEGALGIHISDTFYTHTPVVLVLRSILIKH